MMAALFAIEVAQAQVTKTNLFRREPQASSTPSERPSSAPSVARVNTREKKPVLAEGNLPSYFLSRDIQAARFSESPVILPATPRKAGLAALPLGSVVEAEILESLVAFLESKVPVRAVVRSGPLKGSVFLGEATLERNSKRIMIEFRKFRNITKDSVYSTLANVLDSSGLLGIEGEHHSGEAKYFGAEFLSAAAAGFADASVERNQNILGQVTESASVANATKKAAANALMRTADRFAEKVRSAPEYSVARGPRRVQILVQDQPKLQE